MLINVWTTLYSESWKRYNASLANRWCMESYEEAE